MSLPHRVLIVEDELLIATMLREWIADLGCEPVGPAHTVEAALALIEGRAPHAAILDVSLASQHCYPVADVLGARGIPFAFATGRRASIPAAYDTAPVILKPFGFERVSEIVRKMLDGTMAALR